MDTLLGIAMIYLWVHSVILVFKKVQGINSYEGFVLVGGLIAFVLFVLGSIR